MNTKKMLIRKLEAKTPNKWEKKRGRKEHEQRKKSGWKVEEKRMESG